VPRQKSKPASYINLKAALTAQGVRDLAACPLQEARQSGIGHAGNAPYRHDLRKPAELVSEVWPALAETGFELGNILVDGIVAKEWGKEGLQLSIPCIYLAGVPGWPHLGDSRVEEGEPMVRALVALSWVVRSATGETSLRLMSKMHKAEAVNIAGSSWWSRSCNTDREATLLVTTTAVGAKGTHVYAYVGGGSLSAASSHLLQCIIVRTRNWESGAAVMVGSSGHTRP
jgi:hypothetical protein